MVPGHEKLQVSQRDLISPTPPTGRLTVATLHKGTKQASETGGFACLPEGGSRR